MTAEFKRLGKRGSYRLGQLRAQGIRGPARQALFQPRFNRADRGLPASAWLLGLAFGAVAIGVGAYFGSWFMPFLLGLLAGLANKVGRWPVYVALPAVGLMAAIGWGAPLLLATLQGEPYRAVARELAAISGLPGHAAVGFGVTVLVAVVQVTVGYWLGRTMTPLPRRD
ncbi:MAG: hypothetical protein ACLQFR_29070 [Streptosporangiaceae bacterium]